jgi:aryl-alcohol dehydrogenase-like predicted oxidoreductase
MVRRTGSKWGYGRAYAHDEAIKITNQALDLGINLIDTAEIYGFWAVGTDRRASDRWTSGLKRSSPPRSGR